MSISNFKASEALYIVIVREKNGEQLLKDWAKNSSVHVQIENNRMKLFEQRGLSLFRLEWKNDWDLVTVWDCWNKRHIYFD